MREFHAIVSVTAVDREQADAFFERIQRDALRFGGNLTCLDSVAPDTGGEPHPRLEQNDYASIRQEDALDRIAYDQPDATGCTCTGSGAIDGHAYHCRLRQGV
jgi:hypothetical protein